MTAVDFLNTALPGKEVAVNFKRGLWKKIPEQPWKVWIANGKTWAIYQAVGTHIADTTLNAILYLEQERISAAVMAMEPKSIEAVAAYFPQKIATVLCSVAGRPLLLAAPTQARAGKNHKKKAKSRIPLAVLEKIAPLATRHARLKKPFSELLTEYTRAIKKNKLTDDFEQKLLIKFAQKILRNIGFTGNQERAAAMVRSLETAGWAGGRDHFFHSFQNYFFGLFAILKIPDSFKLYDTRHRLNWDIDPLDVWFPTALWHDIGYGIEKTEQVMDSLYGDGLGEDFAVKSKQAFLKSARVQDGINKIASLMARLTSEKMPAAAWMPPEKHRKTPRENGIINALKRNVLEDSHGAASSLRMYSDCMAAISRCKHEAQLRASQCLQLACVSAPFHDWKFRHQLRAETGGCRIPTDALPFAALLTFVDSIQDDRRDIAALQEEIEFLKEIIVHDDCRVTAKVNPDALKPGSMLWKIVEATDVAASLHSKAAELRFSYPEWMCAIAG